jgi:hypothetical protein
MDGPPVLLQFHRSAVNLRTAGLRALDVPAEPDVSHVLVCIGDLLPPSARAARSRLPPDSSSRAKRAAGNGGSFVI